ncbi:hypothetical protein EK21DRAFT_108185 [Setomelanomma holmii]|uniref:Uncharacterized protein n=1 Tax=Setomelanomma holmii TaxID=210430 RepID=A0A9P4LRW0_9PLEO|nr:hypothetical protein EK21DRAFT_108185 [Setomelanomma holmii]
MSNSKGPRRIAGLSPPAGVKELEHAPLIDRRRRELKQQLGPYLIFGACHPLEEKRRTIFDPEALLRKTQFVTPNNRFAALGLPARRPLYCEIAAFVNKDRASIRALSISPVVVEIASHFTSPDFLALAGVCLPVNYTIKLQSPNSLRMSQGMLRPMPPRRAMAIQPEYMQAVQMTTTSNFTGADNGKRIIGSAMRFSADG